MNQEGIVRAVRWCLAVLMALWGLAEAFASGSTIAAKLGAFHDTKIDRLAADIGWPRLVLWVAVALAALVSAWLMSRRRRTAAALFGLAALAATVNLVLNERSPVYVRVFSSDERMFDWDMMAVVYLVLILSIWAARKDGAPPAGA